MDISEFLELLKPKDCQINKDVMRSQVKEYLKQLIIEKRKELIDSGIWD